MPCPGLLHPEPLPLRQSSADPDLPRRHSDTVLAQPLWGLWVLVRTRIFQFVVILPSLLSIKGRLLPWPLTLMSSCLPDLSIGHLVSQTQCDRAKLPYTPIPLFSHPILLPHGGVRSIPFTHTPHLAQWTFTSDPPHVPQLASSSAHVSTLSQRGVWGARQGPLPAPRSPHPARRPGSG